MQQSCIVEPYTPMGRPRSGTSTENTPRAPWWRRSSPAWQNAATVIAFAALAFTMWSSHQNAKDKSSDEHTDTLITQQLNPAAKSITDHIDAKANETNFKIQTLDERVSRIEGSLGARISTLEARPGHQLSLAKFIDPNRAVKVIQSQLRAAASGQEKLTSAEFADFKNVAQEIPVTTPQCWLVVANIINYQSRLNQISGLSPSPQSMARSCPGITAGTGGHNVFENGPIAGCIVDLNTGDVFKNVIFKNSVIHYSGGNPGLYGVSFQNCTFLVDLPSAKPAKQQLLLAILNSKDQTSVTFDQPS